MNELKHTVTDIIDGYFTVVPEKKYEGYSLLSQAVENVFAALGACDRCDGKGYLIDWVSADVGEAQQPLTAHFCACSRGKQLAQAYKLLKP